MSGVTSGITVSEELSNAFKNSSETRVIKVSIDNESLVVSATLPLKSDLSSDVQSISSIVEKDTPAYLLVQQDNKSRWTLVSYVPDTASVRQKMLYASTRNALTRGLGASSFTDSAFVSSSSDLASTLSSRSSSGGSTGSSGPARAVTSPGLIPLSGREKEIAEIEAAEARERARSQTPRSHLKAGEMAWETEAEQALQDLKEGGGKNLVVLGVRTGKEGDVIVLKSAEELGEGEGLVGKLKEGEPSYVFWAASKGGERSILFIYACPNDASLKEKMVYSASRWNIINKAEAVGCKPARRMESSDLTELTHPHLLSELFPSNTPAAVDSGAPAPIRRTTDPNANTGQAQLAATMSAQRGFARPARPGRRVVPQE